ncbi:unnamed protein product [Mycena citricolor]|uniref:Non-specific serine/threonine protein kinase n=1 Tax=Mycena citricolor TaxID=2018698 RepID=A0AAD2HB18_9AGAR|nr:unnamed protein product [Mycena citricolor]
MSTTLSPLSDTSDTESAYSEHNDTSEDHLVVREGPVIVKKDGMLTARGWFWRSRWLVLGKTSLEFRKSNTSDRKLSKVIPLLDVKDMRRSKLKAFCLLLELKHQNSIWLSFQTGEELDAWQDDIYIRLPFINVGRPSSFVHNIHVRFDSTRGVFEGLPEAWKPQSSFQIVERLDEIAPIVEDIPETPISALSVSELGGAIVKTPPASDASKEIPFQAQQRTGRMRSASSPAQNCLRQNEMPDAKRRSTWNLSGYDEAVVAVLESRITRDLILKAALEEHEYKLARHVSGILHSDSRRLAVLALEGDQAQCFLDAVQNVLDRGLLASSQNSKARRFIIKLSESCDRLPSSLFITGISDRDSYPSFGGGFGDIYQAQFQETKVAVKHLRTFLRDAEQRRLRLQFCREALVWQHLQHPNILPLIGIDQETFPYSLCLISPWMQNGTVLKHLEEYGRGSVNKLLLDIARGLEYLHEQNIIHGDLRGANVLIDASWTACLADFGLTCFSDATSATNDTTNRPGSARWMAPELLYPDLFGVKFQRTCSTDMFAFACVCLELYTGKPPFSSLKEPEALLRVINGERPQRPSNGSEEMTDPMWELVNECWAQDSEKRLSAASVILQIRLFCDGLGQKEATMIRILQNLSPSRRDRWDFEQGKLRPRISLESFVYSGGASQSEDSAAKAAKPCRQPLGAAPVLLAFPSLPQIPPSPPTNLKATKASKTLPVGNITGEVAIHTPRPIDTSLLPSQPSSRAMIPSPAHPILKRSPTSPVFGPHPQHPPTVHFPPSPSLTRIFSVHSSAAYDRSPIVVTPNACALPARGCPGRTYYDGKPTKKPTAPGPNAHCQGRSFHPRALTCRTEGQEEEESDPERTPTRTSPYIALPVQPPIPQPPTSFPMYTAPASPASYKCLPSFPYAPYPSSQPPPLIPDLSSESDESDGFTSPSPDLVGFAGAQKYSYPLFGMPPPSAPFPGYNHSQPPITADPVSSSPPSERRRRRSPRRSRTPHPRSRAQLEDDGYEEEDLPGTYSHAGYFREKPESPSASRSTECAVLGDAPRDLSFDSSKIKEKKERRERKARDRASVSSLCRSLTGASFRDEEGGCLGGF